MNKKIKSLMLSLGTVTTTMGPVVAVVACSSDDTQTNTVSAELDAEQTRVNGIVNRLVNIAPEKFGEPVNGLYDATTMPYLNLEGLNENYEYTVTTSKVDATHGTVSVAVKAKDVTQVGSVQPQTKSVTLVGVNEVAAEQLRVNPIISSIKSISTEEFDGAHSGLILDEQNESTLPWLHINPNFDLFAYSVTVTEPTLPRGSVDGAPLTSRIKVEVTSKDGIAGNVSVTNKVVTILPQSTIDKNAEQARINQIIDTLVVENASNIAATQGEVPYNQSTMSWLNLGELNPDYSYYVTVTQNAYGTTVAAQYPTVKVRVEGATFLPFERVIRPADVVALDNAQSAANDITTSMTQSQFDNILNTPVVLTDSNKADYGLQNLHLLPDYTYTLKARENIVEGGFKEPQTATEVSKSGVIPSIQPRYRNITVL